MTEAEEKDDKESREERSIPTANSLGSGGEAIGQIGPYKLLRVLGEGGFGVVYLAEQERPVKRRVALKVIKPGMDSKQVIARFEAERQALALLDHPNIAYVFNAGTTEAERPYFVMEYVKGVPITEHCDREKLNIEERLKLFVQVCEAIGHAHQKGIIHRDIKPSNIQVAIEGGKALPKIIDFGVAKAISQPLTERTLITEHGQLIGTPEYMSPEQAEMTNQDIDTRSDIYSLGVVLYELLAGALPFDKKTFRQAAFGEIQRIIREQEPPRPSTRLSSLGDEAEKVAQSRRTEVAILSKRLHKELEWIPLKAIRKERTHRYRSASEFADDIQNYLDGNPLIAGPESAAYRIKKFVRRNRTTVTAAMVVVAAVLVGLVVSSAMYLRAEALRVEAEQAREKETAARSEAERQAKVSQAVADFLQDDVLASVEPGKAKGPEVTVRYILDAASKSMGDKFAGEPLVEASICQTLGSTYLSLGKYKAAEPHLERAFQIRREQLGEEHPDTAASIFELGTLYFKQGRRDEAEPLYVKALDIRRRVLDEEHPDTLRSMYYLAWLYWDQARHDEAEPLLVKVLEGQRRVLGEEHADTLSSMFGLAYVYHQQSRLDEAEQLYLKAMTGQRRVLGEEHPDTLRSVGALGEMYSNQGRYDEAEPLCIKMLEGLRRVLGEDHPRTLESMADLGVLYIDQRRYDEAEPLLVRAVEVNRRVLGEGHPETLHSINMLVALYEIQGRLDEAEPLYKKVLEVRRRVLGEEHPDTLDSMGSLGWFYRNQGRLDEAEPLLVETVEVNRRVQGDEHLDTLNSMNNLAGLYRDQGRYEEAETLFIKGLEIVRNMWGEESGWALSFMGNLGELYRDQGRYEEAETMFIKALEIARSMWGEEHGWVLNLMKDLGQLYRDKGRYEEAEVLLVKAFEGSRRAVGEEHPDTQAIMDKLVEVYKALGKPVLVKVRARNPQPSNGAVVTVGSMQELNWVAGMDATEHKVYFGTKSDELALLAVVASPNYGELPHLEKDAMYYWRIDEVQADGSVIAGNVWSFSTGAKLIGWWKLDEGSGTTASDSAGDNHGTIHGAEWTDGQVDGALDFDGTDDYISLGHIGDFAALTISVWVNIDSLPNIYNSLLHCDGWSKGDVHFMVYNNGNVLFVMNVDVEGKDQFSNYAFIGDAFGQWHHIAAVYDSTGKTVDFYIDGQLDVQRSYSRVATAKVGPLRIGAWNPQGMYHQSERCFDGRIDDIRIYNYALSETEIAAIYAGKEPDQAGD